MSVLCEWLHAKLEKLPRIRFPFELEELPENGIYFFYEDGEIWGHGGTKPRIVRIGTSRDGNFRSRIKEHYLLDETKMKFDVTKPPPHDRSIFRKHIGRALLRKRNNDYLKVWNISFIPKANREKYGHLRDIRLEREIESSITRILRQKFSFSFLMIDSQIIRMGSAGLEGSLIGTAAQCVLCKQSSNWLGNNSPKFEVRRSGLWLVQHINDPPMSKRDQEVVISSIKGTARWTEKKQ